MKDPYEVLGLNRSASDDEIQKAYRGLARKYHPDMHQGEDAKNEAQEKFKEVASAYEVLGDKQKRSEFDRFGSTGNGTRNPFTGRRKPFGSPFDDFFNDMFHRQHGPPQQKGGNIVVECEVSLEQVLRGEEVEIAYNKRDLCDSCGGFGGDQVKCSECHGDGVKIVRGPMMTVRSPCEVCGGTGQTTSSDCPNCEGGYTELKEKTSKFNIPPGVETGMRFAFRGEGNPSPNGPPGDVLVVIKVLPHDTLERLNNGDVLLKLPTTYPELILGADIPVPTLDGFMNIKIPAGTQVGEKFRLRQKGLPRFNRGRPIYTRGDQFVQVELEVPTELTEKHRQLIEELAQLKGD